MLKAVYKSDLTDNENVSGKRLRTPMHKRAQSVSPVSPRPRDPSQMRKIANTRRCQSLSPFCQIRNEVSFEGPQYPQQRILEPQNTNNTITSQNYNYQEPEKDIMLPHCIISKTMRVLATKKREFIKLRKNLFSLQNSVLENYASLKDLEARAGLDGSVGDIRILSLKGWPAYDLLLLVREDLEMPTNTEINGIFGPQVLQQLQAQLNPIPEEVLGMGAEIMARRIEMLNLMRCKHRNDRATYLSNLEWKAKNLEFDNETEKLHRMVAGTAENLKAKLNYSLDLAKIPWIDRDTVMKKMERLQKENSLLQHKIEELSKKENEDLKEPGQKNEITPSYQSVCEDLNKERAARESLKEVVTSAEGMLRVARARIATLERQLKELRTELETAQRKHKDLELLVNKEELYRHRESSYDARSKKLLEVSKTGEITIETLSRQRDALENRVKELRDIAEKAERAEAIRQAELRSRNEMLQAKVAEQEKNKKAAEVHVIELEGRVKELEDQLQSLRERSVRLVDMERRRCLEYVPAKETEPSDRETEIWKELQVTRVSLSRAEEELRQSRADKDSFLNSLSRIAQEEGADKEDKMAAELLKREQKIRTLQNIIDDLRENEKIMEQNMTEYENQLATLRLEVKRLRNYECYAKEIPYQDLQTELLELQMQVESLSRERSALVSAAASRALMLERHERAADLFAQTTRARRNLEAHLEGESDPPPLADSINIEVSQSLTSVCDSAADTWSALRAERTRVLRLESAVVSQTMQLERESRVRTQLERRRATLEREILRSRHAVSSNMVSPNPNSNIFFD